MELSPEIPTPVFFCDIEFGFILLFAVRRWIGGVSGDNTNPIFCDTELDVIGIFSFEERLTLCVCCFALCL